MEKNSPTINSVILSLRLGITQASLILFPFTVSVSGLFQWTITTPTTFAMPPHRLSCDKHNLSMITSESWIEPCLTIPSFFAHFSVWIRVFLQKSATFTR